MRGRTATGLLGIVVCGAVFLTACGGPPGPVTVVPTPSAAMTPVGASAAETPFEAPGPAATPLASAEPAASPAVAEPTPEVVAAGPTTAPWPASADRGEIPRETPAPTPSADQTAVPGVAATELPGQSRRVERPGDDPPGAEGGPERLSAAPDVAAPADEAAVPPPDAADADAAAASPLPESVGEAEEAPDQSGPAEGAAIGESPDLPAPTSEADGPVALVPPPGPPPAERDDEVPAGGDQPSGAPADAAIAAAVVTPVRPRDCWDESGSAAEAGRALRTFYDHTEQAWKRDGFASPDQMREALGAGGAGWVRALRRTEQVAVDSRFGAVEAFRAPERAARAGLGWSRLVFSWADLQKDGPRSWDSTYLRDDLLQAEIAAGRRLVGVLINTPPWAGDGWRNGVPRGLDLPPEAPENAWAGFTRRIAERYRGRVDDWVIWNEPDIWDPNSPLFTWNGSVEQFYRLQKVAYLTIKQANPDAQVALPGLTYWWDERAGRPQYLERYLRIAARDPEARAHNWFFDAAVLHAYHEPEQLYRETTLFRRLLAARGLRQPIWISETNVAPWDDPQSPLPRGYFRATLDEQASFIVQAFAWGLAAGAERISVFPFSDANTPANYEQMGLVRPDGSTRPAYAAFLTVTRYLAGAHAGRVEHEGGAVKIALEREGSRVVVAWAAGPAAACVTIPATADSALLVDKLGGRTPIAPIDGAYRVILDPATANTAEDDPNAYLIGGSPVLVVEP